MLAVVKGVGSSVPVLKPHQPDPKTIVCQVLQDKTKISGSEVPRFCMAPF